MSYDRRAARQNMPDVRHRETEEVHGLGAPDLDRFLGEYHDALNEFFRGNPEPAKTLYSHLEDASLANPFGPVTTARPAESVIQR